MVVANSVVEEESGDEGCDVGRVTGHEDDGEAAPHVDQELVGPRLGRLESNEVSAQQPPADPECGRHATTCQQHNTIRSGVREQLWFENEGLK